MTLISTSLSLTDLFNDFSIRSQNDIMTKLEIFLKISNFRSPTRNNSPVQSLNNVNQYKIKTNYSRG